ncbi:metallophosphoesterase [Sphingobacterium sp. KU25419]|nr:metallophosphoesterase [Sphingobacterium sp. KU25419]
MMIKRTYSIICMLIFAFNILNAQSFKFAHVTDTHVGGATGEEDLRRTVKDLNTLKNIDFVILSGDITEFGADHELILAKQILDSLSLPWYVVPGNHDGNWSEMEPILFDVFLVVKLSFLNIKVSCFWGLTQDQICG